MSKRSLIVEQLSECLLVKDRMRAQSVQDILRIAEAFIECLRGGGKILICGNGGSAADAQHLAGELVSKLNRERRALAVISLAANPCLLTSIPNDVDFQEVFSRQVEALGREGDLLVAISTSGRSPNVLRAVERAKSRGLVTVGLTGLDGGDVASLVDYCLRIPSADTQRIQEGQITAGHIICDLVEREFA